jgi:D-cysteine desulfhydrase
MREKATADTPVIGIHEELAKALPTPVRRIELVSGNPGIERGPRSTEIWLKDDGVTAAAYGGNKVRKLAHLLSRALERKSRRIVTFGAAGSHHVLATTLHARALGLGTLAWLSPQPHTHHAEAVLRCALGAGLDAVPVRQASGLPLFLSRLERGDYWIGPGGMGALGSSGYLDAALELSEQVGRGELPSPDWIVVAVGSGSTAAGLLAGLARTPLKAHILGVLASANPAIRPIVLSQAVASARLRGFELRLAEANARIDFDDAFVGGGYGRPITLSTAAQASIELAGLILDPTYTQKAFAAAVQLAMSEPSQRVVFWNTLSAASLDPLLASAPRFDELPQDLQRLLPVSPRSRLFRATGRGSGVT